MNRPDSSTHPPRQRDEGIALLVAAAGLVAGLLTAVAAAADVPSAKSGHLAEAEAELAAGRDSRAVYHLRRHLDSAPGDVEARSVLASAYDRLGLRGAALKQLHLVLAERPDDARALLVLADIQEHAGQYRDALETLERLASLGVDAGELDLREGRVLFRLDRHAEAAGPLERSLAADGDELQALKLHGLNALQLGDLEAARASLGRAAELSPEDPTVRNSLGFTHERLGELELAYLEYLEAEGRSGGNERYSSNRRRLESVVAGR
jgi:Flp pilus assembly protein TadD